MTHVCDNHGTFTIPKCNMIYIYHIYVCVILIYNTKVLLSITTNSFAEEEIYSMLS